MRETLNESELRIAEHPQLSNVTHVQLETMKSLVSGRGVCPRNPDIGNPRDPSYAAALSVTSRANWSPIWPPRSSPDRGESSSLFMRGYGGRVDLYRVGALHVCVRCVRVVSETGIRYMSDAAKLIELLAANLIELLAECEELAEGYAWALTALQQVTRAAEAGHVSAAVLADYRQQAETAAVDLARFRALIAQFKQEIRVH